MSAPTSRLFLSQSFSDSLRIYLVLHGIFRVVGMLRGVILTWFMVKADYGLLYVTLLIVNVLTPLCSLGLNEAVARYVPAFETKGQLWFFLRRAAPLVAGTGIILAGAAFFSAPALAPNLFSTLSLSSLAEQNADPSILVLTRLAACTVFALIGYFLLIAVLKGLRMFRALGLMECANAILFAGAALTCVLIGYRSAWVIIACYLGSLLIAGSVFAVLLTRFLMRWHSQKAPITEARFVQRMFAFSLWAAFAAVVWQLLQYYPVWFLNKSYGPELTGIFGGVRHLAQFVLVAAIAIATVVMTVVTKTWEARGQEMADRQLSLAYKTVILLLFAGCVVLAVGRRYLVSILHPDYHAGADVVPALLAFFLLAANLCFLSIHFNLIEKTRLLFWPWSIGMGCNILFALRWVGPDVPDPLQGAANAGVAAMLVALLVCIVLLHAEQRPIGRGEIIVMASTGLLYTTPLVLVVGGLLLLTLAATTSLVVNDAERTSARYYLRQSVLGSRNNLSPKSHDRTKPESPG